MFIAHGEKVRKNAKWIMLGVLILLIPGFVMLFTQTSSSDRRNAELPTVAGKPVDPAQFEEMKELVRAQYVVMQGRDASRTIRMQDQIKQEAVIQMLIGDKAKAMGVTVSEPELRTALLSQPIFINSAGQFDRERYSQFLIGLNNSGVSEAQFGEVLRQRILIEKIQQLVTAAVKTTPTEVQQAYLPLHEKISIDLVQFDVADYTDPIAVSNEEARAFYEQNKESFRVPATTKIQYAEFTADAARPKIQVTDDEITDFYNRTKYQHADTNGIPQPLALVKALVKEQLLDVRASHAAADRAQEFSLKLTQQPKPEFAKVCADFGVTPVTTDYLTAFDKLPAITGVPDFAARANRLTADVPVSDPIGSSNNFYVLEFIASTPSHVPPYDQIQTNVTDQVKRLHAYVNTVKRAQENVAQLKQLVASGQSFTQACAQLKLKVETPAPFTLADEKPTLPGGGRIQQATLEIPNHGISDLIETIYGGLVFHLRERQPADPAEFEKDRERLARQLLQRNRQALFNDWIQALVRERQVDFKMPRRQPEAEEPVESTN